MASYAAFSEPFSKIAYGAAILMAKINLEFGATCPLDPPLFKNNRLVIEVRNDKLTKSLKNYNTKSVKDDIVQLLPKIFSKIINPFLNKNALSTSAAHLTEKITAYLSVINPIYKTSFI